MSIGFRGPCWGQRANSFLVDLSGTYKVVCGLRSSAVFDVPKVLKGLRGFWAFDKF